MNAPASADWSVALLSWINTPLTATMSRGELILALPVVVAFAVSLWLSITYLERWNRRRREGGDGLTRVARANFRREGFRTVRLSMWVAVAVALALDWRWRGILFVVAVLSYAWSELANATLEWAYQRWAERFLRPVHPRPGRAAAPPPFRPGGGAP
jgi:hypothetical protein